MSDHASIMAQLSKRWKDTLIFMFASITAACAVITKIILLSSQELLFSLEVSNQQVVVWRLTSERDVIKDSPLSLFHLELVRRLWLTALLLIIHLALGVWRSEDHLLGLGRWEEVALSSNIYWPAVLPTHSQNTLFPFKHSTDLHPAALKLTKIPGCRASEQHNMDTCVWCTSVWSFLNCTNRWEIANASRSC